MANELAVVEKQALDLLRKEWDVLKKYSTTTEKKSADIIRTAALCVMESPDLQRALKTESGQINFVHAMKYALRVGVSLNPQEGKAALIPYSGKIQYQIMKNGMIEKALESGMIKILTSKTIRKNDNFELWEDEKGSHYKYEPALTDRGEVLGYVAILTLTDGTTYNAYMSRQEVEEHRDKYAASANGPWKKSFDGMAEKTVIKKILRNVNINNELSEVVGIDDTVEVIETSAIKKEAEITDLNARIKGEAPTLNQSNELTEAEKREALIDEEKEGY